MRELKKYLRNDESILWESAPEAFPLLEGKLKARILGEWVITVLFALWLFYVDQGQANFGTGVKVLVLLVAAAIILSPVVERYSLKNQKYYLTDQRAILLSGDDTLYYMDYDKIDDCQLIRGVAQGDCIAMGSAIMGDVRRQLRWQACHPKMDLQETSVRGEALGMVFYLPAGVEKMVKLMRQSGVRIAA